jgi:hypothetical protein
MTQAQYSLFSPALCMVGTFVAGISLIKFKYSPTLYVFFRIVFVCDMFWHMVVCTLGIGGEFHWLAQFSMPCLTQL